MRRLLLALCLVSPALADTPVLESCAISPDRDCLVEMLLPGLAPLNGPPVQTAPDRLTFLASAEGQPVAIDLSLSNGQVLRNVVLRVSSPEFEVSSGLVGREAGGFALLLWQGSTEIGLQFFGPEGEPLGLLSAATTDDWPLELSLASISALLAGQGALTFDGAMLEGTLYRFHLQIVARVGALTVIETLLETGPEDTLGAYMARRLERQIDPVGAETVQIEGPLTAVTTWASDGTPSRLLLRSEAGGEMDFDQRLGPERMIFHYLTARVTPDGTRLAAIRTSAMDTRLMVFDTVTTAPVFEALLPPGERYQLLWLDEGRIAVLQGEDGQRTRLLILDTR